NGSWYDAREARAHVEKKMNYLASRSLIGSAEDFIDRAATASSVSGDEYLVRCASNRWPAVPGCVPNWSGFAPPSPNRARGRESTAIGGSGSLFQTTWTSLVPSRLELGELRGLRRLRSEDRPTGDGEHGERPPPPLPALSR